MAVNKPLRLSAVLRIHRAVANGNRFVLLLLQLVANAQMPQLIDRRVVFFLFRGRTGVHHAARASRTGRPV